MSRIRNHPGPDEGYSLLSNEFARDKRVSPRAARVYIYLRSHSNGWETNVRRVADAVGMGKNAVAAGLKELVELGYVDREQSVGDDGRFGEIDYVTYASPCPQNGDADDTPRSEPLPRYRAPETRYADNGTYKETNYKNTNQGLKDSPLADAEGDRPEPQTVDETPVWGTPPLIETPSLKPLPGAGRVPDDYTPEFEDWYSRYPKKVGKRDAFKAWWRAVKRVTPAELSAHVDRYAAWIAAGGVSSKQFIPYPATWLNKDQWLDDLGTPEAPKGSDAARAAERAAMTPEQREWEERVDSIFGDAPPPREDPNPLYGDGWDPGLVIDHNVGDLS